LKAFIIFFISVCVLISCTTDSHQPSGVASSVVKNVKLIFPNLSKNHKLIYEDTLIIQLEFESELNPISVDISSESVSLDLTAQGERLFAIDSKSLGGGYHSLRTMVTLSDSSVLKGSAAVLVVMDKEPVAWNFQLLEVYPHDSQSYTQGLLWYEDALYESAGLYARSDLRKVKLEDGTVLKKQRVDDDYFAEGLCLYNEELFQISWREKTAFVYDLKTFKQKRTINYTIGNGEGWGLTHDGSNFIFSDGSANLYFLNEEDWSISKRIRVFDHIGDVSKLNELEYVDGKIYANILNENRIAVINPLNGKVEAYWNCDDLLKQPGMKSKNLDVMNGIAYRTDKNTFLVTGKLWPNLFEISPLLN
jgi:glutamine cyclotransferase